VSDHKATLRDYVDLFDSAAQQIKDNTTRTPLEEGGYEFRHTRITGQPATDIVIIIIVCPTIIQHLLHNRLMHI